MVKLVSPTSRSSLTTSCQVIEIEDKKFESAPKRTILMILAHYSVTPSEFIDGVQC